MVAVGGILRMLRGDRIMLEEKKREQRILLPDGEPSARWSFGSQVEPRVRWSSRRRIGHETGDSGEREATSQGEIPITVGYTPSRSQVRRSTAYDGDGIERPSSTPMFAYP